MTCAFHIVVADDPDDTREYLRRVLKELGHQVVAVETGKQLIELCRTSPPDLAIVNVVLPDMDGIEAAEAINREREIRVILLSSFLDPALRDRARTAHVIAHLIKPVTRDDVEEALALALHRSV